MSTISALVPIGTGIAANSSPTLTAANGALGVDSTQTGQLYIGNGTTWTGIPTAISTTITGVNFNIGLAGFTNCTVYLQAITVGTTTIKMISVGIFSSVVFAGSGNTSTSSGVIPAAYRSINSTQSNFTVTTSGSLSSSTVSFFWGITSAGALSFRCPSAQTIALTQLTATYV